MRAWGWLIAAMLVGVGCERAPTYRIPAGDLGFSLQGGAPRSVPWPELVAQVPPRVVQTQDPYYGKVKRFWAVPIHALLTHGFGRDAGSLSQESFVLRARDGYAVPISGARLLEVGGYVAFDDADVPGFAPIGPQQVSPSPAYMFWSEAGQHDIDTHPRPWQLVTIEVADFTTLYPRVVPPAPDDTPEALLGLSVFRDHCIKCHAINRDGGRVGPELNVPQSVVEYRALPQLRAFIRDPQQFRYSAMPAHPGLSEAELDGLITYLTAMAKHKQDPQSEAHR